MGLLNFVKEAGEKIWDAVSGDSKEYRADKLKKHIDGLNLPGAEKVNIDVAEDGTATVTGDVASQEDKEKILVAVGNVTGVGQVSDGVKVTQSGAESRFYTVKSGDTLSAISKAMYGSANEYQRIFEANKPMLTHPDKIYPGQVLIIPAKCNMNAHNVYYVKCNVVLNNVIFDSCLFPHQHYDRHSFHARECCAIRQNVRGDKSSMAFNNHFAHYSLFSYSKSQGNSFSHTCCLYCPAYLTAVAFSDRTRHGMPDEMLI